jgi:hypothetical protein
MLVAEGLDIADNPGRDESLALLALTPRDAAEVTCLAARGSRTVPARSLLIGL